VTPGLLDRRAPCLAVRGSPVSGRRWCRHKDVQPQDTVIPPNYNSAFDDEIGLQFTELSPEGARAQLEITPKLLQPMGLVHGGVYCSMIESMASVAAFVWRSAHGGGHVVGVNNNTDFLRSVSSGMVYGTAEPIHRGRSQQLWLVTITDDSDRVVARGQVRLQNLEAQPSDG
jgi:1,4-dihydroxy-2-naphthoyl-CoA hydrolase